MAAVLDLTQDLRRLHDELALFTQDLLHLLHYVHVDLLFAFVVEGAASQGIGGHAIFPRVRLSEPDVLAYLARAYAVTRVLYQQLCYEILSFGRDEVRHRVFTLQDLLVQLGSVAIFKRQETTYQCVQDDAAAPGVNLNAVVILASYHLWSRVTR